MLTILFYLSFTVKIALQFLLYIVGGMGMYENITLEFDEGRVASLHISGLIKTENEAVIVGTTGFFKVT